MKISGLTDVNVITITAPCACQCTCVHMHMRTAALGEPQSITRVRRHFLICVIVVVIELHMPEQCTCTWR